VKGRAATTLTYPLESWPECVRRARADKAELQYTIDRLREFNQALRHRDRLPGLALDIRDVLEAFKAAVEVREVAGLKASGMRAHDG